MRIEPEVKAQVEELYAHFGMSVTDAITMFLHISLIVGGLPFDVRIVRNAQNANGDDTDSYSENARHSGRLKHDNYEYPGHVDDPINGNEFPGNVNNSIIGNEFPGNVNNPIIGNELHGNEFSENDNTSLKSRGRMSRPAPDRSKYTRKYMKKLIKEVMDNDAIEDRGLIRIPEAYTGVYI